MPGRQLNFAVRGDQYEKTFDAISSKFLSVVRVPRPDDYGIDAYCHVRYPIDAVSTTVGHAFGVQVRGPGGHLQFGGTDSKSGAWKQYEIEWLRTLAAPLYLARVSGDSMYVDYYSLWPVWVVLGQTTAPFRIICEFEDPTNNQFFVPDPLSEEDGSEGDKKTWTVALGPPFLRVSMQYLNDAAFRDNALNVMALWLMFDLRTVVRFLLHVASFEGIGQWKTNNFDFTAPIVAKSFMAWGVIPGQNINKLYATFEPVLTNVGVHLQHQDNPEAYALIPALEVLKEHNSLSEFGKGLLKGLKETQSANKSPRPAK